VTSTPEGGQQRGRLPRHAEALQRAAQAAVEEDERQRDRPDAMGDLEGLEVDAAQSLRAGECGTRAVNELRPPSRGQPGEFWLSLQRGPVMRVLMV
jgi:hypothetical protein